MPSGELIWKGLEVSLGGRWVFKEQSQVFLAGVGEAWRETGWEGEALTWGGGFYSKPLGAITGLGLRLWA